MDRDEPTPAPVAQAPKPDYGQMWSDYSTWEADIERAFSRDMADLDRRFKTGGGISPEAYMAEQARLTGQRDQDIATLQRGPTYQMLRENYDASAPGVDMVTFYGGPQPRAQDTGSMVAPKTSQSVRRGISGSSGVQEAADLLNRDEKATWYFV